ncbi:hypothetical protein [Marinobacter alexandrii]|jgi:hypothetical protein|uniref:hypothetical protein n=1 Tax=Marinobacter alexandrii TaxID=2570351 RepID=UPI002ABE9D0C|nr:hypothetical protein [Marinobacter alexandrii]
MKRLNRVGQKAQTIVRVAREKGRTLSCTFFFFNGSEFVASSDRLGPARMVRPGTVAVSKSGRQWLAVGGDHTNGAAGWRFVSSRVDQPAIVGDVVRFIDNPKALKIRAKLDAYLEYYQSVKGVFPRSVVLRREQLSACGALPGQVYKGVRLEAYV